MVAVLEKENAEKNAKFFARKGRRYHSEFHLCQNTGLLYGLDQGTCCNCTKGLIPKTLRSIIYTVLYKLLNENPGVPKLELSRCLCEPDRAKQSPT